MSAYQEVFKRIEKKYLLTKRQYQMLKLMIGTEVTGDDYGVHTISNIYFDTDDYTLIRNSIDHPLYKEKLRLRSYDQVTPQGSAFIEIKKKYDGIVYKRRVRRPVDKLSNLQAVDPDLSYQDRQILAEIDWFIQRYQPTPKVFIAYEREALFANKDHNLRLTFDTNIRFRTDQLDLTLGSQGHALLDPNMVLLEVKAPFTFPLWLTRSLSALEITPTSFSKYGSYYKQALTRQAPQLLKGVI